LDSEKLLKYINETYVGKVDASSIITGVPTFAVKSENWISICDSLRDDPATQLHSISNYGAVDFREKLGGFQLVLTLFSHTLNNRVTIKTLLAATGDEVPEVKSLSSIWPAANWFEREIGELFGIVFIDHPDLRHLMLDDDWNEGYPLRRGWTGKDFIVKPEI